MTAATKKPPATKTVRAWEDDPMSEGAAPIERPVPKLPKPPLGMAFDAAQPAPGLYDQGTPEFRWWTTAEALSRAVAFWQPLLPDQTTWQLGGILNVRLDVGDKLNAFYNRDSLSFFHASVKGQTVFSGESPDVATHECGHAVLDAIRPELWGAASHEVAAFHESFGDMSALLVGLQLATLRDQVLADTGGYLNRSSRLSRLAEQFGWAARQRTPCAAEPDCLRNAVNCFFYQPPEQLPITAPAAVLSSEPHSYSRVFTGAFLVTMTGMALTIGPPDSDVLLQASQDAARLLLAAVQAAPVAPNYMSQVAAAIVAADKQLFAGKYADAIANGFVGKGLLTESAIAAASSPPVASLMAGAARPRAALSTMTLPGQDFGFDRPIICEAPAEGQQLAVAAIANDGGAVRPLSAEATARGFLRELLARNRVKRPGRDPGDRTQTHELVEDGGALRVVRLLFDAEVPWPHDRGDV